MVALVDLHHAVADAAAQGGGKKIFFYAASDEGEGLRHGYIHVLAGGATCTTGFEGMDNDRALAEIARLRFIKVQALALMPGLSERGANAPMETPHLLNLLDPTLRPRGTAPARAPEPQPVAPAPAAPGRPVVRHPPADDAGDKRAGIQLAHVRLRKQATELLSQFYGSSAEDKIVDVAKRHDPISHPIEFIAECERLATLMVGPGKARELFGPLRASLN